MNFSANFTETGVNLTTPPGLKPIFEPYELVWTQKVVSRVTMIVVLMILTVIGNLALISIIVIHPKVRRKRVNIFLVNLAIGDLMVCFVTMTTEILFVAFGEWILGAVLCKLMVYGQIVTLASATFLLTGMSIDRYQVIVKPLQSLRGQPKIWRKVTVAWTLALICAAPQLFIFVQTDEGIHPDGTIKHDCRSLGYTADWQRKLYFTYLTTYILVIPTIIMSFCYTNIIKVVWMRSFDGSTPAKAPKFRFSFAKNRTQTPTQNQNHYNAVPQKLISASKRNVIKMTLTVIIGFLVCYAPYFVVSLIRIYSNKTIKIPTALAMAEIMALVHSAVNPILYGMFSTKAARRLCSRICKCCSIHHGGSPSNTVISEDETCVTDIGTREINSQMCTTASSQKLEQSKYERMCGRLRSLWNRTFKKRHRSKANPKIPLLIYGRIVTGNGSEVVKTSSQRLQCLNVDTPPVHQDTSAPRPHTSRSESETEDKSGMVEYLSTL